MVCGSLRARTFTYCKHTQATGRAESAAVRGQELQEAKVASCSILGGLRWCPGVPRRAGVATWERHPAVPYEVSSTKPTSQPAPTAQHVCVCLPSELAGSWLGWQHAVLEDGHVCRRVCSCVHCCTQRCRHDLLVHLCTGGRLASRSAGMCACGAARPSLGVSGSSTSSLLPAPAAQYSLYPGACTPANLATPRG